MVDFSVISVTYNSAEFIEENLQALIKNLPPNSEIIIVDNNSQDQFIPKGDQPVEVEAVYGAAMMIKKEVFEKVKGFDERYFLYYEDIDLCRKVRKIGLKVIFNPQVKLTHSVGSSTKNINQT